MGRKQKHPERGFSRMCETCGAPFTTKDTVTAGRFCSRACYGSSLRRDRVPLADRFWAFVRKGEGCWEWTGPLRDTGYGQIWVREAQRQIKAHRVSWAMHFGPIPEGMFVCHRCDNRACVRPDHLFLGSNADNMADCAEKDRTSYGESRPLAKLTEDAVRDIRRAHHLGASASELARRLGVSECAVLDVVHRRTWSRVQ